MIITYCKTCWCYISTTFGDEPKEVTIIDKTSTDCEKCESTNRPHYHTLRTLCKRGHTMDGLHTKGKNKGVRYCRICARLAEAKHREAHPGYHSKYKVKKDKDAT